MAVLVRWELADEPAASLLNNWPCAVPVVIIMHNSNCVKTFRGFNIVISEFRIVSIIKLAFGVAIANTCALWLMMLHKLDFHHNLFQIQEKGIRLSNFTSLNAVNAKTA